MHLSPSLLLQPPATRAMPKMTFINTENNMVVLDFSIYGVECSFLDDIYIAMLEVADSEDPHKFKWHNWKMVILFVLYGMPKEYRENCVKVKYLTVKNTWDNIIIKRMSNMFEPTPECAEVYRLIFERLDVAQETMEQEEKDDEDTAAEEEDDGGLPGLVFTKFVNGIHVLDFNILGVEKAFLTGLEVAMSYENKFDNLDKFSCEDWKLVIEHTTLSMNRKHKKKNFKVKLFMVKNTWDNMVAKIRSKNFIPTKIFATDYKIFG